MAFLSPRLFPGQICPESTTPPGDPSEYLIGPIKTIMAVVWKAANYNITGSGTWLAGNGFTHVDTFNSQSDGEVKKMSEIMCQPFYSIQTGQFEDYYTPPGITDILNYEIECQGPVYRQTILGGDDLYWVKWKFSIDVVSTEKLCDSPWGAISVLGISKTLYNTPIIGLGCTTGESIITPFSLTATIADENEAN